MTARQFHDVYYTQPYSWQKGFEVGKWQPSERDKVPPVNPCAVGTVWRAQWQAGFDYRRKLERGET